MSALKIIDAHIHFYDYKINKYTFLEEPDPNFIELVGDYSALPRKYMPEDYLKDTANYQVDGVVWHEYLSTDPIKEVKWADEIAKHCNIRQAIVALVDFLDPDLQHRLETYKAIPHVTAVREHMGWDEHNPKRRFAERSDLLRDASWKKGLTLLEQFNFKCGLEIFSPQLPDLIKVIQRYPNIGFTIALMGWPSDLSDAGFQRWKQDLKLLSRCENVCIEIMALECIFGMKWTMQQVTPWILTTIELFGTERCMFGSHMPIAKLSRSFAELYRSYEEIVAKFSHHEKENLFSRVAAQWFRV